MSTGAGEQSLGGLGEAGILADVFAALPPAGPRVGVGPGDDAAVLAVAGNMIATTDAMVLGRDWRHEWSSAADVGAKAVVQNLADVAAMGGVGTAILVTLVAPVELPASWAKNLVRGILSVATPAGVDLIGGDLSSSEGALVVSVTALGRLPGPGPVLRSGASPGQLLAASEPLGRSGAGWWLLQHDHPRSEEPPEQRALAERLVDFHRRPSPDLSQGPAAALAGAGAMIDVSDGLVRDAGRIAAASGVGIDLDPRAVAAMADLLTPAVTTQVARECVLTGGEEHALLATFDSGTMPDNWLPIGRVLTGRESGVLVGGVAPDQHGWDHFGG